MTLYHATFAANLPGIKKYGLGHPSKKLSWSFSDPTVTCFVNDIDAAESFCEEADNVSEDVYNSGIIILAIDDSEIKTLFPDENIIDDYDVHTAIFVCTNEIIPFNKLKIVRKTYDC